MDTEHARLGSPRRASGALFQRLSLSPARAQSSNPRGHMSTHMPSLDEQATGAFPNLVGTPAVMPPYGVLPPAAWPASRSASPYRKGIAVSEHDCFTVGHNPPPSPPSPLSAPRTALDTKDAAGYIPDRFVQDGHDLMLQGLQARVQVLERRLVTSGASRSQCHQDASTTVRSEVAQAVQSERSALRHVLATEMKEALQAVEERLKEHVDQAVKPSVELRMLSECLTERVRDLEHRLDRQLTADTATLAGVLARCQEQAADLKSEASERHACLEKLREDLLQQIQDKEERMRSQLTTWSANVNEKILNSASAALEGAFSPEGASSAGAALRQRVRELLEHLRETLRDELRRESHAHDECDNSGGVANARRDEGGMTPDRLQAIAEQLRVDLAARLTLELDAERDVSSKRHSELQASASESFQEGAAAAAEAARLRESLALVEAQMGTAVEEVAACCQDLYSVAFGGGHVGSAALPTGSTLDFPSARSYPSSRTGDSGSVCRSAGGTASLTGELGATTTGSVLAGADTVAAERSAFSPAESGRLRTSKDDGPPVVQRALVGAVQTTPQSSVEASERLVKQLEQLSRIARDGRSDAVS